MNKTAQDNPDLYDANVIQTQPLPAPTELIEEFPVSKELGNFIRTGRNEIHDILTGKVIVYDNTFEGRLNSALSEFGYTTARKIGYIIEDANGRNVDFRNGCMGVTDKIYAKEPRNIRHLGYTRNATAWLFNVESGF